MKKRKHFITSTVLDTWVSPDSFLTVTLTKHTQIKSGISMFSLDLNGEPVVTCDSPIFLKNLVDEDFELASSVLLDVFEFRNGTLSFSESEE